MCKELDLVEYSRTRPRQSRWKNFYCLLHNLFLFFEICECKTILKTFLVRKRHLLFILIQWIKINKYIPK